MKVLTKGLLLLGGFGTESNASVLKAELRAGIWREVIETSFGSGIVQGYHSETGRIRTAIARKQGFTLR